MPSINESEEYTIHAENKIEALESVLDYVIKLREKGSEMPNETINEKLILVIQGKYVLNNFVRDVRNYKSEQINLEPILKSTQESEEENKVVEKTTKKVRIRQEISQERITFLEERGIVGKRAKDFARRRNYFELKVFAESIDQIFEDAGLESSERNQLYINNKVLILNLANKQEYLDALGELFDKYNPTQISGILPRNQKKKYADAESIRSLIPRNEGTTNIIGLDLIYDENVRQHVEMQIESDIFAGMKVGKRDPRSGKGKTFMYKKCVELYGKEAHFRKIKHGSERILAAIEHIETGEKRIEIFEYHKDHKSYMDKLGIIEKR